MDIWLIYLLKTLLLPVASLLILSFFGCFYVIKNKGKGGGLLLVPLLFLFILSLPVVAVNLLKAQESYPALDYSQVEILKPQAIVVLAGGMRLYAPEYAADSTLNHRSLLRIRYAAYLAKVIKLPILVSGGSVFEGGTDSEASLMATVLRKEFNTDVHWLETRSRNTAENALFSQNILQKDNVSRIVLITHAMHMARAVRQFENRGLVVIPAPTMLASREDQLDIFSFLPSVSALESSSMAIHEWLGRLWYEIRY